MRYTHTGTGRRGRRRGVNKWNDRGCGETGRGQLASALSRRRYICHTCSLNDETRLEYRPHFVLTICQCEPSACFTRRVRLLLIIITLSIGGDTHTDISYSPIRQCCE